VASFGGETTSGNVAVSMGAVADHAACDATIARLRTRAEATEAKLAEVRQGVTTFLGHYGNTPLASFKVAQDLAEGIRQVLDREPLGTQERDGKESS
jgi:hypothetical protein